MNLQRTLSSLKTMLQQKGTEIGLNAKDFFASPQPVHDLVAESEISLMSSLSDDDQYFHRYDGSYQCLGLAEELYRPWLAVKSQSAQVLAFLAQWQARWKELDEEMRSLNRDIVKQKRGLNAKRPANELEHLNRQVESRKEELKSLKKEGESEMNQMKQDLEALMLRLKEDEEQQAAATLAGGDKRAQQVDKGGGKTAQGAAANQCLLKRSVLHKKVVLDSKMFSDEGSESPSRSPTPQVKIQAEPQNPRLHYRTQGLQSRASNLLSVNSGAENEGSPPRLVLSRPHHSDLPSALPPESKVSHAPSTRPLLQSRVGRRKKLTDSQLDVMTRIYSPRFRSPVRQNQCLSPQPAKRISRNRIIINANCIKFQHAPHSPKQPLPAPIQD